VRVPSVAAAARATAAGNCYGLPLPADSDRVAMAIIERVVAYIDERLPSLVTTLFNATAFDDGLLGLHRTDQLRFSAREPGVNIYGSGGEFLPHMVRSAPVPKLLTPLASITSRLRRCAAQDHEALTVLIPLTSPSRAHTDADRAEAEGYVGGGTGFWAAGVAQEARSSGPPTLVLRPAAGTALVFGGHVRPASQLERTGRCSRARAAGGCERFACAARAQVMHAGMPVVAGTRACFVASFSSVAFDYDFYGPAPRARALYAQFPSR